jgi:prolyl-tRNA synthetase
MAVLETRRTHNGFWGDEYFNTFSQIYIETKDNKIPIDDDIVHCYDNILYDDRDVSFGIKMFDAELICVYKVLVLGNKHGGKIEVIDMKTKEKSFY